MSKAKTTATAIDPKTTEVLQLDLENFERKDLKDVNTVNVSGSHESSSPASIDINFQSRKR